MIEITNKFSVKCKKCGTENEIDINDFGVAEINSEERNMGYETEYYWNCVFDCFKCSNSLEVIPRAFEYPIGVLNYEDVECHGCKIIIKPEFSIVNEE
ncbi:MAG: hypothetical protein HOO91_09700 [Bacteroidales bacterium]|nr:hypothetical protein [Bacteroidales bacterium]